MRGGEQSTRPETALTPTPTPTMSTRCPTWSAPSPETGEGRRGERKDLRFWTTPCWTTRDSSTLLKRMMEKHLRQILPDQER